MDKILEIIKEKLESPILTNFFIGLLLFNKKVVYAALATNYSDKVEGFYLYNKEKYESEIELFTAIHNDESYFCLVPACNLFLLPLFYAVIITGLLPYIKSFFKAVNEHSENFYKSLDKKFNNIKIRTEKEYNDLENKYTENIKEKELFKKDYNQIFMEKSNWEEEIRKKNSIEFELKQDLNNNNIDIENYKKLINDNNKEINDFNFKYINRQKAISEIFDGVWFLTYEFVEPTLQKNKKGSEYFKILNGCEIHTSNTPNGDFDLRCYIDRYVYNKSELTLTDEVNNDIKKIHSISFKKTFVLKDTDTENPLEYCFCNYSLIDENNVSGIERYYDKNLMAGNKTNEPDNVRIRMKRHLDF